MARVTAIPVYYLLLLYFSTFYHGSQALYDVARYCQLVPTGTKLPSFESCHVYYSCKSDGYIQHSCYPHELFDKDSQSCKPSNLVDCYANLKNPCSASNAAFVPNVQNCKGFISCKNHLEIGRANCPDGQIFDAQRQVCKYGSCENEIGSNLNGDLEDLCKIMRKTTFFGDFESCRKWKLCNDKNKLVEGLCEQGLVFDVRTRMCLKDNGQMCRRLEVPAYECNASDQGLLKGDHFICSDYYRCDGKKWHKFTCPNGEYFDIFRSSCVQRKLATPTNSCNRCQYAHTKWVNAVDTQCIQYYECYEGRMKTEGSCDVGAYFHERRQICIIGATNITEYRMKNGACRAEEKTTEKPEDSESSTSKTTSTASTTEAITTPKIDTTSSTIETTTISTSEDTSEITTEQSTTLSTTPETTTEITQEKCQRLQKGTFKADTSLCSIFYQCNGSFWIKHICPTPQYFDVLTNQCKDRQAAITHAECDRCQYATAQWVNAVDPQCSKYLICQNGHKMAQNTCGDKSYFDENRQTCVIGEKSLIEYRKHNVVCQNNNDQRYKIILKIF